MRKLAQVSLVLALLILIGVWIYIFIQFAPISLPDFSSTYSITITDDWSGLSSTAPENSLYFLESSKDHFEGAALFSVGGYSAHPQTAAAILNVPTELVQAFLDKLSQAEPERGRYEPNFQWTDDNPEITIRLVYGESETIEFDSSSQGDQHIPWQITFGRNSYIINSGSPAQALELLKPYLAQDVRQKLIDQVNRTWP